MRFSAGEVAAAVGGRTDHPDVVVDGIATDSRAVAGGELFVPVRSERDGHDFIGAALAAGAAAFLTERPDDEGPSIVVADASAALLALASHGRDRVGTVVGITGSVGKTTTKDLVAALLAGSFATHASPRSFNNQIGVPHTILDAPDGTEVVVAEIGTNAPGEIGRLCAVARPDIGVVTRVAPVHTLGFGDIDGVATEKADLVRSLPGTGLAVLNGDDERVAAMAGLAACPVLVVGEGGDVVVEVLDVDAALRCRIRARTPWGDVEARLGLAGRHQATNAGLALAVAGHLGVALDGVAEALAQGPRSAMRMDVGRTAAGALLIDDTYNANPTSTEAALRSLAEVDARRRVAVLGHMAELGATSDEAHRRVAGIARELSVEAFSVGEPAYGLDDLPDVAAALHRLADLGPGDAVLVKGSRAAGLDRLAAILRAPGDGPGAGDAGSPTGGGG
jgi:UDP-N-acetylmuramoyl-tripeptide--D-alanyl-D-alanine ligase